jgi:type I restriction enzyme, S subunit
MLPPVEEQKLIVQTVKEYFEVADKVEKQIEKAEVRVSKLTQAILAKTFRLD